MFKIVLSSEFCLAAFCSLCGHLKAYNMSLFLLHLWIVVSLLIPLFYIRNFGRINIFFSGLIVFVFYLTAVTVFAQKTGSNRYRFFTSSIYWFDDKLVYCPCTLMKGLELHRNLDTCIYRDRDYFIKVSCFLNF